MEVFQLSENRRAGEQQCAWYKFQTACTTKGHTPICVFSRNRKPLTAWNKGPLCGFIGGRQSSCTFKAGYEISDREEWALSDLLEPSRKAEGHTSPASGICQHNRVTRTEMWFFPLNLFFLLPLLNTVCSKKHISSKLKTGQSPVATSCYLNIEFIVEYLLYRWYIFLKVEETSIIYMKKCTALALGFGSIFRKFWISK